MYSDYISINKNFLSSINLEYDLNDEEKIQNYIPTNDICDIIKIYIKNFLGKENKRSTVLVGPYGKGKSYLILVLNYLLSNNKNSKTWINLVNKIKKIDTELFELLIELKEKNINLLTIIINSNYESLKQSFLIALKESLVREHLNDIVPTSTFKVCVEIINKWQNSEEHVKQKLKSCLEKNNSTIEDLLNGLNDYAEKSYKLFLEIYNCINIGLDFNPLINDDITKMYNNLLNPLDTKGYKGILVIFDEFSKFLENKSNNLAKDLKFIQDFAENASRSKNKQQINFVCITHKDLSLYNDSNRNIDNNLFKTIEGRFTEIHFNRSISENYKLITNAIQINDKNKVFEVYQSHYQNFYSELKHLSIFSREEQIENNLFIRCFPLNPITAFCLIQMAELVAQNERTLFTFLCDSDNSSLNYFLHNNETGLLDLDSLYDYFKINISNSNSSIKDILYRSEAIISKLLDYRKIKIVKSLSILLMIKSNVPIETNKNILALATSTSPEEISFLTDSLIADHILRINPVTSELTFALSTSKYIDEQTDYLIKTKFLDIQITQEIDKISDKKFILPRKYNFERKIKRYLKNLYIEDFKFINLSNYFLLLNNEFADGIILNILITNPKIDLSEKLQNIPKRIIISKSKQIIPDVFFHLIKKSVALRKIQENPELDEISKSEIKLLNEELVTDINALLDEYFPKNNEYYSSLGRTYDLEKTASEIFSNSYNHEIIFNNELVNKMNVSPQYQTAINNVIEFLLQKREKWAFTETSPESTILSSIIDEPNKDKNYRYVVDAIKHIIETSDGNKVNIKSLIGKFKFEPYGIRDGILPLILAKCLSELTDNVILYFENKEIELKASNIVKATFSESYTLLYAKKSIEQDSYFDSMLNLYLIKKTNNFQTDLQSLVAKIKNYFLGLPKILRVATINNNFLNIEENYIKFKNLFLKININPYEAIFTQTLNIFKTNIYKKVFIRIAKCKNLDNQIIFDFQLKIINQIKLALNIDTKQSFKKYFDDLFKKNSIKESIPQISILGENLYLYLSKLDSFNDLEILNNISRIVTNCYIEDWEENFSDKLIESLINFVKEYQNSLYLNSEYKNKAKSVRISPIGDMLKQSLSSTIDEFNQSVPRSEKIAILYSIIEDLK